MQVFGSRPCTHHAQHSDLPASSAACCRTRGRLTMPVSAKLGPFKPKKERTQYLSCTEFWTKVDHCPAESRSPRQAMSFAALRTIQLHVMPFVSEPYRALPAGRCIAFYPWILHAKVNVLQQIKRSSSHLSHGAASLSTVDCLRA